MIFFKKNRLAQPEEDDRIRIQPLIQKDIMNDNGQLR